MKRMATDTFNMNHKRHMGQYSHLEIMNIVIDRMAVSKLNDYAKHT